MPMKKLLSLAAALALTALISTRAENLGELVAGKGVEWIIGNWEDTATGGQTLKLTYEWRLDKNAIAMKVQTPDMEVEGLIARNPKNGDVGYVAVDNRGGGAIGKITRDDEGRVVMMANIQRANGDSSRMGIVHEKKDASTIKVSVHSVGESGELGELRDTVELSRKK
jgi:hypothetical protein